VIAVTASVNDHVITADVPPRLLLSDFLRHNLGLTGTHVGCEHGVCGACTVLLDGDAVRSCLLLAVQIEGAEVTTVEGLAEADALSTVQQVLGETLSLQCGFCTPGIAISLTAALSHSSATEEQMLESVGGHLCRCTGYQGMRTAIRRLAQLGSQETRR
jgi:aerobic carbon-monoxide dehydrogenase small subunit